MDVKFVVRKLVGYGQLLVSLFSLFLVVAFTSDLFTGQLHKPADDQVEIGVLIGLLVFFAVSAFLSGRGAWKNLVKTPQEHLQREEDREIQQILQLAAQADGCISLSEVAIACELSIERSQAHLTELVDKGIALMDVSENGALLYRFPDFARKQLR